MFMQNVQVFCPHCSQIVSANAPYKDVICPYCNQVIFFDENDKEKIICICGKKMSVVPKYANRNATCPRCGADIFIPKFQITNTSSRTDLLETFSNSTIESDNMLTSKISVNKDQMASLARLGLSSEDEIMPSDSEVNVLQKPEPATNNKSRSELVTEEFKLDFGDREDNLFQSPILENEEEEQHELMLQEEEDELKNFEKGNIVHEHGQAPYYDLLSCSPIIYNSNTNNNDISQKRMTDFKTWPFMAQIAFIVLMLSLILFIIDKLSQKSSLNNNDINFLFSQNQFQSQEQIFKKLSPLPNFSTLPGKHKVKDKNTIYTYSIDKQNKIRILSQAPIISSNLIPNYDGTEGYHTTIQDNIVYEYQVDESGDIIQYQKFSEKALIDSEDIPKFSNSRGLHMFTSEKTNMKYEYFINEYGRIVAYIKSRLNSGLNITFFGTIDIPDQKTEPGYYTTEDENFSYSYWIDENHKILACQAIQLNLDEENEVLVTSSKNLPATSSKSLPVTSSKNLPATSSKDLPATSLKDLPATSLKDLPATSLKDSLEDEKINKQRKISISPMFKMAKGLIKRAEENNRTLFEEIDSCLEILEHYETYYEIALFFPQEMKQVNNSKEEYNKRREEYQQKKQFFEDRENITQDEVQILSKQFSRYKNELEELKETLKNIQVTIEASPIVTALIEIENISNKEEKFARWFWLVQYNSTIQNRLKKLWKLSSKKGSYPQEKLHHQMQVITENNSPKSLYEKLSLECFEEWDVAKSNNIAPQKIIQEILELKDRSTVKGKIVSEDNQKIVITVYFNATNFNNITIKKSDIVSRKKEKIRDPLITKQAKLLLDIVKNINDKKIVDSYNMNLMWQKKCLLSLEQQREVIWQSCPYMIFSYIPTLKNPFENNLLTLKICHQCHGKNFPCSYCEDSGIVSNDSYAKFVVTLMHASEEKE